MLERRQERGPGCAVQRAFALIDLLVVIASMAIVPAMLLPGFGSQQPSAAFDGSPTNHLAAALRAPPKVTGVVQDTAGGRLAGVQLALWPEWRAISEAPLR
jgi:hypothetical protein